MKDHRPKTLEFIRNAHKKVQESNILKDTERRTTRRVLMCSGRVVNTVEFGDKFFVLSSTNADFVSGPFEYYDKRFSDKIT